MLRRILVTCECICMKYWTKYSILFRTFHNKLVIAAVSNFEGIFLKQFKSYQTIKYRQCQRSLKMLRPSDSRSYQCTYLSDVVQIVYLRGEASVHAEELLVHERGQRQTVERFHTRVVDSLRVLYLTCNTHLSCQYHMYSHKQIRGLKILKVVESSRRRSLLTPFWRNKLKLIKFSSQTFKRLRPSGMEQALLVWMQDILNNFDIINLNCTILSRFSLRRVAVTFI